MGTKALREIHKFQKLTELLIQKIVFYRLTREILQKEQCWLKIQASAMLDLHEAGEAYLVWLFKDSNLCTIHVKHITVMPRHAIGTSNQGGDAGLDVVSY